MSEISKLGVKCSVAILTHNREKEVTRAIDSALDQEIADIEIVVLDNGSSDNTTSLLRRRYGSRICLVRSPVNLGCPSGRNHLYANCNGDYIINIDDDGYLEAGTISKICNIFDADAEVGIIALRQRYVDESGTRSRSHERCEIGGFSGGLSAFRSEMLRHTGGYPFDFFMLAEESYLSIKCIEAGYKILSAPDIVMFHPRIGSTGSRSMEFYRYRNPLLVVLRLYPGAMKWKFLIAKTLKYAVNSYQRKAMVPFLFSLLDVTIRLPKELWRAQPASKATLVKYLDLNRKALASDPKDAHASQ